MKAVYIHCCEISSAGAVEIAQRHPETWRQQPSGSHAGWSPAQECSVFQRQRHQGATPAAVAPLPRGDPQLHQTKCKYSPLYVAHWAGCRQPWVETLSPSKCDLLTEPTF